MVGRSARCWFYLRSIYISCYHKESQTWRSLGNQRYKVFFKVADSGTNMRNLKSDISNRWEQRWRPTGAGNGRFVFLWQAKVRQKCAARLVATACARKFWNVRKEYCIFFHRSHRSKVSHDTRKQKEFRSFVLSSFRNSISFPEKLIKREKNSTEEFPLYSYTFDQT